MANGVSIKVILDKRRKTKQDLYPIRIRIIHNRECRHFSLPDNKYLASDDELKNIPDRKLRLYVNDQENRANDIIEKMPYFDFVAFEKQFYGPSIDRTNFYDVFQEYINHIKDQKRFSTADNLVSSLNKLKEYSKTLHIHQITPEFLQNFENWLLKGERSYTTIGIYTRNIRTIYNYSISKGYTTRDLYPFGKSKYEIPAGRNIKKALTKSEVKLIIDYKAIPGTMEEFARDIWVFSYLCNGMNINDIARIKYKNIVDGNSIVFYRQKTRLTKKQNQRPIKARLNEITWQIIERHGNPKAPDNFIFDIIKPRLKEDRITPTIRQTIKNINKYIRRIGSDLDIKKDITTYTARHSFATILKLGGAPSEYISEKLGHHDLKTTENYLDSFDDDTTLKYNNILLDFDEQKQNKV